MTWRSCSIKLPPENVKGCPWQALDYGRSINMTPFICEGTIIPE